MKIISRKEAKAAGLKDYFTGKPCKHGHVAKRKVRNHDCFECRGNKSREYYVNNRSKFRKLWALRDRKISNLLAVLRAEMPELLKEFGL